MEILPYYNVTKYEKGFLIKYCTEYTTFAVVTQKEGEILDMFYYCEHLPKILDEEKPLRGHPVCEITFSDGTVTTVKFEYKNGTYYVSEVRDGYNVDPEYLELLRL